MYHATAIQAPRIVTSKWVRGVARSTKCNVWQRLRRPSLHPHLACPQHLMTFMQDRQFKAARAPWRRKPGQHSAKHCPQCQLCRPRMLSSFILVLIKFQDIYSTALHTYFLELHQWLRTHRPMLCISHRHHRALRKCLLISRHSAHHLNSVQAATLQDRILRCLMLCLQGHSQCLKPCLHHRNVTRRQAQALRVLFQRPGSWNLPQTATLACLHGLPGTLRERPLGTQPCERLRSVRLPRGQPAI